MSDFRKELKYSINNSDFNIINETLNVLLKKDEHCKDKFYTVTSIYFDNYKGKAYNQVKCGLNERWKYRIRFYNYDDSYIKLEKKYKINNLTNKKEVLINKDILYQILDGSIKISKENVTLLNEFILSMKSEMLRPIICIEYDRIPYTYRLDNVRITLDYNIRYTSDIVNLFSKNKKMYYLKNKVLEIKYDDFIPDFIFKKLNINHLSQSSFSKFKSCVDKLRGGNLDDTWNI